MWNIPHSKLFTLKLTIFSYFIFTLISILSFHTRTNDINEQSMISSNASVLLLANCSNNFFQLAVGANQHRKLKPQPFHLISRFMDLLSHSLRSIARSSNESQWTLILRSINCCLCKDELEIRALSGRLHHRLKGLSSFIYFSIYILMKVGKTSSSLPLRLSQRFINDSTRHSFIQ